MNIKNRVAMQKLIDNKVDIDHLDYDWNLNEWKK